MRKVSGPVINGIDINEYMRHPRVVELRLVLLNEQIKREYGEEFAQNFIRHWCDLFKVNYTLIRGILNQTKQVLRLSLSDRTRFRQEVVFMGHIYKESRMHIAKRFLNLSSRRLYRENNGYGLEGFLTEDWCADLTDHVAACGIKPYKIEAERFLDEFEAFRKIVF
ncbi:MAG: hypothetical protein M0P69_11270 [Bacteroidales bacterium]|nr:hypothetical protein [Bacteroidales bacterium]